MCRVFKLVRLGQTGVIKTADFWSFCLISPLLLLLQLQNVLRGNRKAYTESLPPPPPPSHSILWVKLGSLKKQIFFLFAYILLYLFAYISFFIVFTALEWIQYILLLPALQVLLFKKLFLLFSILHLTFGDALFLLAKTFF